MSEFPGLPAELLDELRTTLSKSRAFNEKTSLRRLFTDSRIQLWVGRVPFAPENREGFINEIIDEFVHLEHAHLRKNGLVLLLEVLVDQENKWDDQYKRLGKLIVELQQELFKRSRSGLFDYKLDRMRQLFKSWDGESNLLQEQLNQLKSEFPAEKQYLETWDQLLEVVLQPEKSKELLPKCRHLPQECVQAYILAYRTYKKQGGTDPKTALDQAYHYLPLDEIPDYLADQLEETRWPEIAQEPHTRVWPIKQRERISLSLQENRPHLERLVAQLLALRDYPSTELFWGGHKLFQQLQQKSFNRIIYGEPGSGKSLLAYALSQYPVQNQNEWVLVSYFPFCPTLEQLTQKNAQVLRQFLFENPAFLGLLQSNQFSLLAQTILTTYPSARDFQAAIETIQRRIPKATWLQRVNTENEKEWTQSTRLMLSRLAREVKKIFPEPAPLSRVIASAQALGFQQLLCVIDLLDDDIVFFQETLFPQLWQYEEVQTTIFVSPTLKSQISPIIRRFGLSPDELKWEEQDLAEMLAYAFEKVVPIGKSQFVGRVYDHIEPEALTQLIQGSQYNPYQLIQQLQRAIQSEEYTAEPYLTKEIAQKILKGS